MAELNEESGVIPRRIGDLSDVDSAVAPTVNKSGLVWNTATGEWTVRAPGTAIAAAASTGVVTPANAAYVQADQTANADAIIALVTAVNDIRAALTAAGITL